MIHFIIGVAATVLYGWLSLYSRRKDIQLNVWKKLITILGILYTVFVAEVIVGFVHEQELKAALVMGATTGIFAIIWAILLGRFVFQFQLKSNKAKS